MNTIIKIAFSDIDGTLVNSEHNISEKTASAIHTLQKKGIPFVPISARSPEGIYPVLSEVGLHCPVVACNGAILLDNDGKMIAKTTMPWEITHSVLNFLETLPFDVAWNLYTVDGWFVKDDSDARIQQEEHIVRAKAHNVRLQDLNSDTETLKILCLVAPVNMAELQSKCKELFPMLNIVPSSNYQLEIMDKRINKAEGMRQFCSYYGIDVANALAFGDHYNDCEMLKTAGCGVLMANSPDDLKNCGFYPTLDNDHDGLAFALENLNLI